MKEYKKFKIRFETIYILDGKPKICKKGKYILLLLILLFHTLKNIIYVENIICTYFFF